MKADPITGPSPHYKCKTHKDDVFGGNVPPEQPSTSTKEARAAKAANEEAATLGAKLKEVDGPPVLDSFKDLGVPQHTRRQRDDAVALARDAAAFGKFGRSRKVREVRGSGSPPGEFSYPGCLLL